MWKPRNLTQKLVLNMIAATSALLVATVWVGYESARRSLENQINAEALKQVQSIAATMDSYANRVAILVRGIAAREEAVHSESGEETIEYLNQVLDDVTPDQAYG